MRMITDRLPTADDGDADGDVNMKRRPDSRDNDTTMVHWSHVKQGVPWRHTFCWKPNRKPAPVTPFQVGQAVASLEGGGPFRRHTALQVLRRYMREQEQADG